MAEAKKINYGLIFTIIVTVSGWAVTFGICQQKIETNIKDIQRVENECKGNYQNLLSRQESTDGLLRQINSQLVELNTKMSLLLSGDIKADK